MIRSLSVLLPVHNVQSSLGASVQELLDVLAELTERFELVVIDDGSTDGTCEVARELSQRYPQVRLLHESIERPASASRSPTTRIGATHGDVVIAHDGRSPIDARQIVRLWRSLMTTTPAPKFLATTGQATRAARSTSSRTDFVRQSAGFRILRPAAIDEPRRAAATAVR